MLLGNHRHLMLTSPPSVSPLLLFSISLSAFVDRETTDYEKAGNASVDGTRSLNAFALARYTDQ